MGQPRRKCRSSWNWTGLSQSRSQSQVIQRMALMMKRPTQEGRLPWKPRTTGDGLQLLMHALFPDFVDFMDYFPRFIFKDNFPDFLISASWSQTRRVCWRSPLGASPPLWSLWREKSRRVTSIQSQRRNNQWWVTQDLKMFYGWYFLRGEPMLFHPLPPLLCVRKLLTLGSRVFLNTQWVVLIAVPSDPTSGTLLVVCLYL